MEIYNQRLSKEEGLFKKKKSTKQKPKKPWSDFFHFKIRKLRPPQKGNDLPEITK